MHKENTLKYSSLKTYLNKKKIDEQKYKLLFSC